MILRRSSAPGGHVQVMFDPEQPGTQACGRIPLVFAQQGTLDTVLDQIIRRVGIAGEPKGIPPQVRDFIDDRGAQSDHWQPTVARVGTGGPI